MITYCILDNTLRIEGIHGFNLARSCDCGQTFRWHVHAANACSCVIRNQLINVSSLDDTLIVYPCSNENEALYYINYFDLHRDYAKIESDMLENAILNVCVPYASGIRVFNQEPFETLISFIISANNNIKRISNTVDKLCCACGARFDRGLLSYYAFPTPQAMANLSISELESIGTGYRAPYIKATATEIAHNNFDLESLRQLPYLEAKKSLCTLMGVGPKVADCVLLFSLGHTCAFPMDVWMKRAVSEMFFSGRTPTCSELNDFLVRLGKNAGIIQQYLFHYARAVGLGQK